MDRFKRSTPTNIKLTERDFSILKLLATYRALDSSHIAKLLNLKDEPYYRRRLRALFDHGFLDRIKNYHNALSEQGSDKIIYALADKGANQLKQAGEKLVVRGRTQSNNRIRVTSLKHDLLVMDFLTSLLDIQTNNIKIIPATKILADAPEHQRKKRNPLSMSAEFDYLGEYTHKGLIPDGLFGIQRGSRTRYYFLEVDTGSENQTRATPRLESILRKMKGYVAIYKNKVAKDSFNIPDFKVLFLTTTDKRIDYMIHTVYDEYIAGDLPRNIFMFSTFTKMKTDTLADKVWVDCLGQTTCLG